MNTAALLKTLVQREDLTREESTTVVEGMLRGEMTPSQIGAILTLLRAKGENEDEILGFIRGIKKQMVSVRVKDAIDVCGTGGDGKNTFNISTATSFVVAGVGVNVAKHGNRGVSSKSGSADVMEALGVHISLTPQQAEDVCKKVGMVFLFAPLFHTAFKHVAPIRKELGIPTIFNFLGPFLSPAHVKRQLIGVSHKDVAQKLIRVSKQLGCEHLCIVVSADGMDEVSMSTKTKVYENKNGKVSTFVIDPKEFGFRYSKDNISGGSREENAQIIISILKGEKGQRRDIVVLNSAVALFVAGKAKNIKDGVKLAEKSIDSENAMTVLNNLRKETQKYA